MKPLLEELLERVLNVLVEFTPKLTETFIEMISIALRHAIPAAIKGLFKVGWTLGEMFPFGKNLARLIRGEASIWESPLGRYPTTPVARTVTISSSPTFNITANISSEVDVRDLASKLSDYWQEDIRRHIR